MLSTRRVGHCALSSRATLTHLRGFHGTPASRANGGAKEYVLKTGTEGADRLRILEELFAPGTERFFRELIGVKRGWHVADIGCGTGGVARILARLVGPEGRVTAIDASEGSVAIARSKAEKEGIKNVTFRTGSAFATELPDGHVDMTYCRALLVHLNDPVKALREFARVTRTGGVVSCEEPDLSLRWCEPPHPSFERYGKLLIALGAKRNQNFKLGRQLHTKLMEAGLPKPNVAYTSNAMLRGESKRLVDLTLAESVDAMVKEGVETRENLEKILSDLRALAADETTLFVMNYGQAWATKPAK